MIFPILHIPVLGDGMTIALDAVLHVLISHGLAIGAVSMVVLFQALGASGRGAFWTDLGRSLLGPLVVATTSIGAVTGVGIWFITGALAPAGIGSLIHLFFWPWFIEWGAFTAEVVLLLFYYYLWPRLAEERPKALLALGLGYVGMAVLSGILISGILGFMLTPDGWPSGQRFVEAYFNPTFVPQCFLRIFGGLSMGALVALAWTAWTFKGTEDERKRALRLCGLVAIGAALVAGVAGVVYFQRVPQTYLTHWVFAVATSALSQRPEALTWINVGAGAVLLLAALAGLAGCRTASRLFAIPALILCVGLVAEFERVREFVRGPYLLPGYMQPAQDLTVDARSSRTQYQYTLEDADPVTLAKWAPRFVDALRARPELIDVSSDQQDQGLRLQVDIDRATAARLGITPQDIDNALYNAFGQRFVSTIFTELNQYRVVLAAPLGMQEGPSALDAIYLRSADGKSVPLNTLVSVRQTTGPLVISRQGQFPSVTASFNLAPGVALGEAVDAVHAAAREVKLPDSTAGAFQGTAQAFMASLGNQPLLILAALITVYIVLGVMYESYIHPVTILSTLPSAGVGAVLALLATRTDLSVIAIIGIILLIGIVKKNGILMVDFAIEAERKEGLRPEEAIRKACLLRFRPIMMTTMAALLGALPLALGHGVGSELRRPLGITIIGGLLFSQAMTLYTTPVVYLYMERARLWVKRRGGKTAPPAAGV